MSPLRKAGGIGTVGSFLFLSVAGAAPPAQLSLDEALATAATRQPQLRAARAQARAAKERIRQAQTGYLPRVEVNGQYQRATANFVLSPSFANSHFARSLEVRNQLAPQDTVNYFLFGATASETVFDFGRTGSVVRQAEAFSEAQSAEAEASAEGVALSVRTAFFSALAARELVRLGEETVANQKKHVAQVRQFVEVGTRPKIDLSSAELVLANAELALVRARNGERNGRLQLATAMGVDGAAIANVVLAPAAIAPLPEENAPAARVLEEFVKARPEYRRALALVRREEAEKSGVRSAYLPGVVANGSFSGTKVGAFDAGFNWFVGLGLTWNLSGVVLANRQTNEIEARLESAAAGLDSTRLALLTDIDQQLLAVREAKERLGVADRTVATATERLQLAEVRYRAGTSNILELDDAQVAAANSKAQRVQAEVDLAIARARLGRALGRTNL
jgi:outer membrane protein